METTHSEIYKEQRYKRSQWTQALVDKLKALQEGDRISYEELGKVIHGDVQYKYRYYLNSAINILRQEYSIVLECIIGEGFRRMTNEEISGKSTTLHRNRLRQDTKVYQSKIDCVDVQRLTSEQRLEHTLALTHVAMRQSIVSKPVERKIEAAIAKNKERWVPDRDAFIAVFGGKG